MGIHRRDCGRGISWAWTSSHPFIAAAVIQCGEQISAYAKIDSIDGGGDDRCRSSSWQFVMHTGHTPIDVQLSIGFEAVLALFMTFFLFVAFPHRERIFFGKWTPERLGAVCIVGIMATTGMGGLMVGPISISGMLLHLTILLAALVGGLPFSTTIGMIIAAIVRNCGVVVYRDDGCVWYDWLFCRCT